MRYTGEARIRFKGRREIAATFIPLARTLLGALITRDRDLGGLRQSLLRRTFPGGLYIEVSFIEDQHQILIDVSGLKPSSFLEKFKDYVVFPPYSSKQFPTGTSFIEPWRAPSPRAVGLELRGDTAATVREVTQEEVTARLNFPEEGFNVRAQFGGELDWISPTNVRLYCAVEEPTSKYALHLNQNSESQQPTTIRCKGISLAGTGAGFDRANIGVGMIGDYVVWLRCGMPDRPNEHEVTVRSRRVEVGPDRIPIPIPDENVNDWGTFNQDASAYGLDPDNPDLSRSLLAGSYWFNFSPDGLKAVRCVVFEEELFDGDTEAEYTKTTKWYSFKDELTFAISSTGNLTFTRAVTDNPPVVVTTHYVPYETETADDGDDDVDIGVIYDGVRIRLWPNCPRRSGTRGPYDSNPESINVNETYADTETSSENIGFDEDTGASGMRLVTAYDYADDGTLATLTIEYSSLSGQRRYAYSSNESRVWSNTVSGLENNTTPSSIYPFEQDLTSVASATRTVNTTKNWNLSLRIRCNLIYNSKGRDHIIPYFDVSAVNEGILTLSSSGTYSRTWHNIYDPEGGSGPGADPSSLTTLTGNGTGTRNINSTSNTTIDFIGAPRFSREGLGAVCIDMRNGLFVTSMMEGRETMSASGSTTYTEYESNSQTFFIDEGDPSNDYETGSYTGFQNSGVPALSTPIISELRCDRVDTLYVCRGGSVAQHTLSRVEGMNTPGRPAYELNHTTQTATLSTSLTSPAGVIGRSFDVNPLVACSRLGAARGAVVEGVGGSIATDPDVETAVFSVLSSDLFYDYPPETVWAPVDVVARCRQATYAYGEEGAYSLSEILWASVVMTDLPINNPDPTHYGLFAVVEYATLE